MSEWISINERLPEDIKGTPFSEVSIGYCDFDKCQYIVILLGGQFVHLESGRIVHGGITHWMPLPAPPK